MSARVRAEYPRGVWRAPFLRDGYPVAIAVDSQGREVASITLYPRVRSPLGTKMRKPAPQLGRDVGRGEAQLFLRNGHCVPGA